MDNRPLHAQPSTLVLPLKSQVFNLKFYVLKPKSETLNPKP